MKRLANPGSNDKFVYRSTEILRIEALSDAVFAFSVSLLVASLEVPQTFNEIKLIVREALPFFTTIAVIFTLWYQQYVFFRHYALNDFISILYNLIYLAVILFYIYPLKFLFSLLISSFTGIDLFPHANAAGLIIIDMHDFPTLIMVFSAGYFFIWLLLYLMHRRAMAFAKRLLLNNYEITYTHKEIRGALWNCLVGVLSIVFAAIGFEAMAGIVYLFIPLLLLINERIMTWQIRRGHF